MANDEHVAILKKGVDAWNAWRDENRTITPNLSGADLTRADLSGANLHGAGLIAAGRTSTGRTSRLPPCWIRTLRALISPGVTSTAYPRGV
jgi:hypothetical protein